MSEDGIEKQNQCKKDLKKRLISTQVNISNPWLWSWDQDEPIKTNHETQFLTNSISKDKFEIKIKR